MRRRDPADPLGLGDWRRDIPSPSARWMDADEVLQVLIDLWRHRNGIDPDAQFDIPLHRDTNIEAAANLIGLPRTEDRWYDIAHALMYIFRVHIDPDAWRARIDPRPERTLGPVCDLIAEEAWAPRIERRFGEVTLSWQAAAFRSILLILRDAGADIGGITPRTKLRRHLVSHPHAVVHCVSRLHPGRLPPLTVVHWLRRGSAAALLAGFLLRLTYQFLYAGDLVWLASMTALIGGGLGLLLSTFVAGTPRLGDLTTFGDLAYTLTSPPPRDDPPIGPDAHWDAAHHPNLGHIG